MKNINIINAIGTGVGKTFVASNLIKIKNIKSNKKNNILKPVISGFKFDEENDVKILLDAVQKEYSMQSVRQTSKYLLSLPLSINIAAELEGVEIVYEDLLEFCFSKIDEVIKRDEELYIELAGGALSPITQEKTMLDLTSDITKKYASKCTNILVTSNYLGSISHTISVCRLFEFDTIIFNPIEKTIYDERIKTTMQRFAKKDIISILEIQNL